MKIKKNTFSTLVLELFFPSIANCRILQIQNRLPLLYNEQVYTVQSCRIHYCSLLGYDTFKVISGSSVVSFCLIGTIFKTVSYLRYTKNPASERQLFGILNAHALLQESEVRRLAHRTLGIRAANSLSIGDSYWL
jgi:hypothetical protein